ncbi:MAG: hypothetical protein QG608_2503 [Actinomycetota bacterium]|nr:hypothetical protein [Actinomycetota bacterium]
MATRLTVDSDGMRSAKGGFNATAHKIETTLANLKADLDRLGECWGKDDATAKQFAASYQPGRDKILEGLAALGESVRGLEALSQGNAKMFDNLEDANTANAGT